MIGADDKMMERRIFTAKSGLTLNYVIHKPGQTDAKRPAIVYLHGTDGCGSDVNTLFRIESLPSYVSEGRLTIPYGAMLIAPQCPKGMNWNKIAGEVVELIDKLTAEDGADGEHIALTGASLGGMGTFSIAIKYPERFSCLVPVCGSVDPLSCALLTKMPVWIFHGEFDRGMGFSVIQAHEMINRCGGSSKLTLLSGQGHEIRWIYHSDRFDIINWMLAQ